MSVEIPIELPILNIDIAPQKLGSAVVRLARNPSVISAVIFSYIETTTEFLLAYYHHETISKGIAMPDHRSVSLRFVSLHTIEKPISLQEIQPNLITLLKATATPIIYLFATRDTQRDIRHSQYFNLTTTQTNEQSNPQKIMLMQIFKKNSSEKTVGALQAAFRLNGLTRKRTSNQ